MINIYLDEDSKLESKVTEEFSHYNNYGHMICLIKKMIKNYYI